MDRQVRKVQEASVAEAKATEPRPEEKLLKYFPESGLALYVALDPLVRQAFSGDAIKAALWVSLALAILFCWLYLARFWHVTSRQRLISVAALVLYIAAIGGPFSTINGYKTIFGTIAAVVATAFIIFVPSEDVPHPPR